MFFLVFKNLNQKKKKTQGNPKKTIFWPETKTSPKSFGFLVFWFSRGFVKILFCWKRRVLLKEEEFLRLYTTFWKFKVDAKKNKHLNIVKSNKIAQIPVNSEKVWVLGGGYQINIHQKTSSQKTMMHKTSPPENFFQCNRSLNLSTALLRRPRGRQPATGDSPSVPCPEGRTPGTTGGMTKREFTATRTRCIAD